MPGPAFQIELTPEALPARTDLATLPFAVLLANARMMGVTGLLELRAEKRIFFSKGVPVRVESDIADETSELYLLRSGAVQASDLGPARELAKARGGHVGEALLGLGVLDPNELFEHTRNQARDSLIACFNWEKGPATFEARERLGPEILQVPLDVARVFLDGMLRFYDRRRLDRELPVEEGSRLYVVASPRIAMDSSAIGTVEARILKLAGGRPALASAALAVGLSADDLRRRAYALYCLGLVGFEVDAALEQPGFRPSAPPPAAAPTSGHVPRAGTGGTSPGFRPPMRPAVDVQAPRPSQPPPPPRQSQPPPPPRASQPPPPPGAPVRRPSSPSFAPPAMRPSEPPRAPAPAKGKSAMGPKSALGPHAVIKTGKATKSVQAYLEDAEFARAAKDWSGAYLALEYALELEPENPFVWGEKAYTMMVHDPRTFGKEANTLARDARRADPTLPIPYVVLGMLMEQIRETERAIQMYKVALQKDPLCEAAQERLDKVEAKHG